MRTHNYYFPSILIYAVCFFFAPEVMAQSTALVSSTASPALPVETDTTQSTVELSASSANKFELKTDQTSIPATKSAQVSGTSSSDLNLPTQKSNYSAATFVDDVKAIKWDAIGAFAGITALGIKSWKWGNTDFHFGNEKWFQKDRSSIGMDKLGHAFTSYTMTNLFAEHLQRKGRSNAQSAISAALLTQALMLYVETFDGFSSDHGFSYEDVVMNLAGTSLAYARQRYPQIKELVDYRMEYSPSGYKGDGFKGFRPISDYAGQKYHLVFKLGGVKSLRDTPLKYAELHAGYYARGFTQQEQALGISRTRTGFVGIGLNLSELLFGARIKDESTPAYAGRTFLEHIQLPIYAGTKKTF